MGRSFRSSKTWWQNYNVNKNMNLKYLKQEAAQQMWGYLWTFLVWLLIFSTVECIRMYYNFQNQMFTGSKPTVSTKFAKAYQRMRTTPYLTRSFKKRLLVSWTNNLLSTMIFQVGMPTMNEVLFSKLTSTNQTILLLKEEK